MARIEHLAFIAGGVIVPRLSELALAVLFPDDEPDVETKQLAVTLEGDVARGTLPPDAYCRHLLDVSQARWEVADLARAICERLAPTPGMTSLLAELGSRVDLRLVCDYPREWWEPTQARHDLGQFFAKNSIVYTMEGKVASDYAAFFATLIAAGVIQRGRTLWVDYHSPRTSAAVRNGIDAAIFVDAPRLRRDLGLWGLVPLS